MMPLPSVRATSSDHRFLRWRQPGYDPERHLGGKRFSAQPVTLDDGPAGALFGDILESNREQHRELRAMRARVRRAIDSRPKS